MKDKTAKKVGRPTLYSQELADRICERLMDGESLRHICLDEDMPHRGTVMRWLGEKPEFSDQYARAKEEQAELLADEIVNIADGSGLEDNAVMTARDRLRVDARKWVASKLKAKKYGDRIQQEVTGKDGEPLAPPVINIVLAKPE